MTAETRLTIIKEKGQHVVVPASRDSVRGSDHLQHMSCRFWTRSCALVNGVYVCRLRYATAWLPHASSAGPMAINIMQGTENVHCNATHTDCP